VNPLDRLKQQQASAGAQAPARVRTVGAGKRVRGRLEDYQASVAVAIEAMKAFPAMTPERETAKKQALADVLPWVRQYVEDGNRYPNSVAVQAMIWLFDTGQIEEGLNLGLYLIKTGQQKLPSSFKRRELAPFLIQSVYDWANAEMKAKRSTSPYLEQLIASMCYAMAAKQAKRVEDWKTVVEYCEKAQAVNPTGAGVHNMLCDARDRLAAANRPPEAGRAGEDGGGESPPAE
jgi:hypothetical protein